MEEALRRLSDQERNIVVSNPDQMIAGIHLMITQLISDSDENHPADVLSPRELETFRFLAAGLTNREIAEKLGISVKTIDTHRGHMMKKLGLRNNADVARVAIRYGYTSCTR